MVGTGSRGTGMWGRPVTTEFSDIIDYVGLCDINEGRAKTAQKFLGREHPVYTDFEKMMKEQKPDILVVTTVDATHSDYVIRAMELGLNAERRTEYELFPDDLLAIEYVKIPQSEGHNGRDAILWDRIFKSLDAEDKHR